MGALSGAYATEVQHRVRFETHLLTIHMIISIYSSRDLKAWEQAGRRGLQSSLGPYGIEHLARLDFTLAQAAAPRWLRAKAGRRLRAIETRAGLTVSRTLLSAGVTSRSDIALAILEPQGYAYSVLAGLRVRPWSSTPLAVLSCWLADEVRTASRSRRAWLRRRTLGTDLFIYWSTNQREILREQLGIPDSRLFFVPFGIEASYFYPRRVDATDSYILAAGLDRGRDYRTFMTAVRELDYPVKLVCPKALLRGLTIPRNVELLGLVEKARYRALLQDAAVVVVPVTPSVSYPTGQTVLLDAMSCGVPTVVTRTSALADYVRHAENTWTVPGEDPDALRGGIERVLGDPTLAATIAAGGRSDVVSTFNAEAMWRKIAPRLRALASKSGAPS
jgi:glycosyltransferase involved in cell wall biosynthesis